MRSTRPLSSRTHSDPRPAASRTGSPRNPNLGLDDRDEPEPAVHRFDRSRVDAVGLSAGRGVLPARFGAAACQPVPGRVSHAHAARELPTTISYEVRLYFKSQVWVDPA